MLLLILAASCLTEDFWICTWVICIVAALAASRLTKLCLHSCCVPRIAVFDVASAIWPEFNPLSPGRGGWVSIMCWCGIGEEDCNERKWEALRTIQLASCQNGTSSSQHDHYSQDESCWVWLQVEGVSHCHAIYNMSDRSCLFANRDILRCTTAGIAWFSDINGKLFEGKDVCWCLYQIIPGILHEPNANNQVMLYG